jgi:hypothetical protein
VDKYPHLKDTSFPNAANVDVFKYENTFDYSAFDDIQMTVKLISVPWDLGEVHVGLRSIPMGNVVGWESVAERDAWLDSQEGEVYESKYRSYHDGDTIKIPVPYEYAQYRNYLVIDYSRPPVTGTDGAGISRWLYFIRDIRKASMSATEATLQIDAWSMFINSINFSHMVLERGHYAMAKAASVTDYLAKPIANTSYLTTPDVSYGAPSRIKELGFINEQEGDNCYVIACTGNPEGDNWGTYDTDGWRIDVQGNGHYEQKTPSYFCFAIDSEDVGDFWVNVRDTCPQFMATVKCVYLISKSLVYYAKDFTFCKTSCHMIHRNDDVLAEFGTLTKELFNYGKYSEVTKLYTAPYCHIEVSDGEGKTTKINIEDCASGTLKAYRYLSIAYPYASVRSFLAGIGDDTEHDVTYTEITARNFKYSGSWWDTIWEHNIPTYAIIEGSFKANQYNSWYSYKNSEEQLELSQNAELDITKTKLAVNRDMVNDSMGLAKYTTTISNTLNEDMVTGSTSESYSVKFYEIDPTLGSDSEPQLDAVTYEFKGGGANASLEANSQLSTYLSAKQTQYSNRVVKETQLAEAETREKTVAIANLASTTTTANSASVTQYSANNSAWAGVAGSSIGGVTGTYSGGSSGIESAGGIISASLSGALGQLTANTSASIANVNASINANSATANAAVITNLDVTVSQLTRDTNGLNLSQSSKYTAKAAAVQKARNKYVLEKQTAAATKTTAANAASSNHNYQMTKALALGGDYSFYAAGGDGTVSSDTVAQADATYYRNKTLQNKSLAKQIERDKDASRMRAPIEHGTYSGGSGAVKPRGLWANVVTQPSDAIAQAGTEMLRYGYYWDGAVDFETFNVMSKFSYWKVRDIWATAQHLPDAWVDLVRNLLLEGVTVWSKPEYINKTSVFDNTQG